MSDNAFFHKIYNSDGLDIKRFELLLSNNDQGYKFFWLEALMRLCATDRLEFEFDEIINEMIWEAYRTVTYHHLRLGHTVNGNAENFLEHAIKLLYARVRDDIGNKNVSREKIVMLIKKYDKDLKEDKEKLTDYVPYRIIKPFVDREGKTYIDKSQYGKFISYLEDYITKDKEYFYTIIDSSDLLTRKVRLNEKWQRFMIENYSVIMGWIQYKKALFIQKRNPCVPGVVDKIFPESEEGRKSLKVARDLWKMRAIITGEPLKEIYTGKELSENNFELDHFVPRSFTANDELWNLIPISKELNVNKSNYLPPKKYIEEFADYQYDLYRFIFYHGNILEGTNILRQFEACRKNYINADWALNKLYVIGNSSSKFKEILRENIENIYELAYLQEYEIWPEEKIEIYCG